MDATARSLTSEARAGETRRMHRRWVVFAVVGIHLGACAPAPRSGASSGGEGGNGGNGGSEETPDAGPPSANTGGAGGRIDPVSADAAPSLDLAPPIDTRASLPDAAADANAADARPDALAASDTGRMPNPALDQRCTVPVTFTNKTATSPGRTT